MSIPARENSKWESLRRGVLVGLGDSKRATWLKWRERGRDVGDEVSMEWGYPYWPCKDLDFILRARRLDRGEHQDVLSAASSSTA